MRQELIVATDGGKYEGTFPACASASALSRRARRALCRSVSAACSGARKSRNPSGRSRSGSKSTGAEFTGTIRFEKGSGVSAGFSLVAVAIMLVRPFCCQCEAGPVGGEEGNSISNIVGIHAFKPHIINKIGGPCKAPPKAGEKLRPRDENFAHPRRLFSRLKSSVQYAEHLFNFRPLLSV